jgi:hypothetical protein
MVSAERPNRSARCWRKSPLRKPSGSGGSHQAPRSPPRKPWLRCQAHAPLPSCLRFCDVHQNADQAPHLNSPEPRLWHGRERAARSVPAAAAIGRSPACTRLGARYRPPRRMGGRHRVRPVGALAISTKQSVRIPLAVWQKGDQHRDAAAVRPIGLRTELRPKEALLRASFQPKAEDYEPRA